MKNLAWSIVGTLMIALLLGFVFYLGFNLGRRPSNDNRSTSSRPLDPTVVVDEKDLIAEGPIWWFENPGFWALADESASNGGPIVYYRLEGLPVQASHKDTFRAKMKLKVRTYETGRREADILEVFHFEKCP